MLLSAPSRRRTRLGAIPLLFLTIVGLLVGGLSAPAFAANAIRGVVTNFDGTPLQGVQVQLGTRSGSTFTAVGSSTPTGADGSYEFTGVAAGDYVVRYTSPVDPVLYFNAAGAASDTVTGASLVTSGATDATVSESLRSRTVKGRVTSGSPAVPVPGATVTLELKTAGPSYAPAATLPSTVTTDDQGNYQLSVAPSDNLVLGFAKTSFVTRYANGGSDSTTAVKNDAAPLVFSATANTPLVENATLDQVPGGISGTVTRGDSVRTSPLNGATVRLLKASDGSQVATTTTATIDGQAGKYSFSVVPGDYKVEFSLTGYDTEFFNEKTSLAAADVITLAANGARTDVNATLVKATPEISGLVTTTTGAPISGVVVSLHERQQASGQTGTITYTPALDSPSESLKATTGTDGRFAIDASVSKNYVVKYTSNAFETVYWNNGGAGTSNPDTAPVINLVKGTGRAADVTVALNAGITFKGFVRDNATTPAALKDVQVTAQYPVAQSNGGVKWVTAATTTSGADGSYSLVAPSVAGRDYVLGFAYPTYLTYYYTAPTGAQTTTTGTTSRGSATKFAAATADTKVLSDIRLAKSTTVSGTVVDAQGLPLSGVSVEPVKLGSTTGPAPRGAAAITDFPGTMTGPDGAYVLTVPAAKTSTPFRLRFTGATGRETRFFPNASVFDEGQNVSVATDQNLTGRDVTLPNLATLGGSITASDGTAFTGGGIVQLWRSVSYNDNGEQGGASRTSWFRQGEVALTSSGGFSFAVPSGVYKLKAVGLGGQNTGFMPGLVGLDQAPAVALGVEQNLSLQKFALPARSTVSGQVNLLTGSGAANEKVSGVYRYVENIVDGAPVLSSWITVTPSTTTGVGGLYSLDLFARTYRIGVLGNDDTVGGVGAAADKGFFTTDVQPTSDVTTADDVVLGSQPRPDVNFRLNDGAPRNLQPAYVTGIAQDGQRLTAEPGTWSASDATYSYRWQWSKTPDVPTSFADVVDGQQGSFVANNPRALDLPQRCVIPMLIPLGCSTDAPAAYRVVVTATRPGVSTTGTSTSKPTSVAAGALDTTVTENRQDPQITGKALVGETLTATDGVWSEGGTFTYQWLADGQVVPGATSKTIQLTAAQLGAEMRFRVTHTQGSGNTLITRTAVSQPTSKVGKGVLRNQVLPTISGDAIVGKKLTAEPGTWNDPSPVFAYQWLANSQPIPGARSSSYVLTDGDLGKSIAVVVTATKDGNAYAPGTATSASTAAVGEDPTKVTNKTAPVVSGTAKVGEVLTTTDGTWTNDPTTFTYQWAADGTPIAGATAKTLTLAAAQAGKKVTVTVTAAKAGLTSGTATSAPTAAVAPADPTTCTIVVTGGPTVTGTAAVGQLLTAQPGMATPDGVTPSYQWLRDAQAIAGATASTYRVVAADQGSALAVQVTYRKTDCADVVRTAQAGTVPEQPQEPVKPSLSTVKKIKGTKLVLKVNVTATTQDPVAGVVDVAEGNKTLATKTLVDGKRKFVVRGFKRGFHSVQITFQGNSLVKERTKTITFNIR